MGRRSYRICLPDGGFKKEHCIEKIPVGSLVKIARSYHEAGTGDPGDLETQEDLSIRPFVEYNGKSEWIVDNSNMDILEDIRLGKEGK